MSTKIILGMELGTERRALIESAAQDLSLDESAIASLDKGEAILSSNFSRFAVPFAVPLFENLIQQSKQDALSNPLHDEKQAKRFPELQP